MQLESLKDLFINELRDLYSAENQLTKALPKMAKNAHLPELKEAFEEHLRQTETHLERLNQIFQKLDEKSKGTKCKAMEGLIDEAKELLQEKGEDNVMDAGIICAAQKIEHYEIASYGTARAWAEKLGENEVAELLEQTLNEEKEADEKLNQLAESNINDKAAEEDGGEGEEAEEEVVGAGRSGNGGKRKSR